MPPLSKPQPDSLHLGGQQHYQRLTPWISPHSGMRRMTVSSGCEVTDCIPNYIRISSLRDIPTVKGALLDQFGVLHDGREPYPGAVAGVEYLHQQGVKLLIISNSSRRSSGALDNLARMGFPREAFSGVITSGEVTHQTLSSRPTPFWRARQRCIHFTWAARGAISLQGLGITVTTNPDEADFILAHGTEAIGTHVSGQGANPRPLEDLKALLLECATRRSPPPPLIIANPDIVTVHGSELVTMPGTLGKWYATAGGEVHLMGKPAVVIYEEALRLLDLAPEEVIAIGDSLEHDVAGATGAGIRSVFIAGGIHAKELRVCEDPLTLQTQARNDTSREVDDAALLRLCRSFGTTPDYVLPYFSL